MAASEMADLQAAWRALAGGTDREGWKAIPIATKSSCLVQAGRRLPSDEEALLVGFGSLSALPAGRLPQGQGFEVLRLLSDPGGTGRSWIALAKRAGASPELFAMMSEDLVRLLEGSTHLADGALVARLLARVSAWQDFMERHREGLLSIEAELGLFGELTILGDIIELGADPRLIVEAWQGPLGGNQDFIPGTGALEVKSTLATSGFPASIASLEQLDDSIRQPLFLAAVRLSLDPTGVTLPERADSIKSRLAEQGGVQDLFDIRLLQAGLLPKAVQRYTRRFLRRSTVVLAVSDIFPRLTRRSVHPAIGKARYEIELDLTHFVDIGLERALQSLGTI
ncbi:hypothetical protein ASF27_11770 [Methylobacterium sp. Leaf102]|nr:hypothetical protein ASF27_11770 [Methylobacterium sp. Leaf102]